MSSSSIFFFLFLFLTYCTSPSSTISPSECVYVHSAAKKTRKFYEAASPVVVWNLHFICFLGQLCWNETRGIFPLTTRILGWFSTVLNLHRETSPQTLYEAKPKLKPKSTKTGAIDTKVRDVTEGGKRIGLGDGTPHVTTTSVVNCSKYIGPKELTWWCHRNKTKKVERKRRRLFRHDFLRSYRQQHAEHSLVCFDRSPFAAAFPPAQSSRRFIAAPASGRGVQHISLPLEPSRLPVSS